LFEFADRVMQALQLRPRAAIGSLARLQHAALPRLSALHTAVRIRHVCHAEGGDAEALPGVLTVEEARGVLGVAASASFDDILSAKSKKLEGTDDDGRLKARIHAL
jgi:hypothetical protein